MTKLQMYNCNENVVKTG